MDRLLEHAAHPSSCLGCIDANLGDFLTLNEVNELLCAWL
ncbi:hypothetical protein ARMA_1624 [Ardenticatena maritima]|uniref:Uncharacterized protein n=1 Tax=Ardenticatena maritima TaxID=872965 RepID=A0A0M8K8V3_9CHLR|nr:hypothetical protein ARMA_1624 [Ardenticatena maritima]